MTLLLFLPCKDGIILISDRLETSDTFARHEKDKILVSKNSDFAIAGCDTDSTIEKIFASIERNSDVNGENIDQMFEEITREIFSDLKYASEKIDAAYFLIVAIKNGHILLYDAQVNGSGRPYIREKGIESPLWRGDGEDLLEYLLKDKLYRVMNVREVIQYALAVMNEISKWYGSVGGAKYGFSIVFFTRDFEVLKNMNYRGKIPNVDLNIQIDQDSFDLGCFEKKRIVRGD